LLFHFPKSGAALRRDFKWTGSHRYGIVHLGAADHNQLRLQAERASAALGWPAPYAGGAALPLAAASAPPPVVHDASVSAPLAGLR
jgi:hypothetical protein